MFFNSQRITKSAIKELAKTNKISEEQNIINNRQKLIDIKQKEKMKDLLIVKYMNKYGIKKPQKFLEEEISKFSKGEKLKKIDLQKINTKMKEILNMQKGKKKILKSPSTILSDNKLPDIDPTSPVKKKEKLLNSQIQSCLSTGNLKTISQPFESPLNIQHKEKEASSNNNINNNNKNNTNLNDNTISSNSINRRIKKKIFISPEEEIVQLEKELGLDENTNKQKKRGYERLFKFFSEGNEWEAIDKYNKELYDQEIEEEKRRKFAIKIKLKEDLEKQIKDKVKRDYIESLEEKKYKQIFNEHNKEMEKQEKENLEIQHKRLLLEKKAQAEQIKARKIKERLEMLKEKRFDKNTIKAVQKEIDKEQKFLLEKKIKEDEMIKKDKIEAEKNIKKKLEKLKLQKDEDKKFCQELEKMEIKREMERNKILSHARSVGKYQISEDTKKIIEKIKKDEDEEDEKLKIYLMKKKKLEDEKEEMEKNRRLHLKDELKIYLERQIEEKKKEREFEKNLWKEQGKIWNIDSEKYKMEKENIENMIKKMNYKNAEKLREQIQYKKDENIKKKSMSIMEYSLNKNVLNKIMDSMENEKNNK